MADRRLGRLIQKWLALAGPGLAAGLLLLSWAAAVEGREQVTSYMETKLTAADGEELDLFGASVAISGDTAVIGAWGDDDLGSDAGSAYVFARDPLDPTLWSQTAKLTAADGEEGDHLGGSVAISGDTAVIGASGDDDLGFGSGSAYVFARDPLDRGPSRCPSWSGSRRRTAGQANARRVSDADEAASHGHTTGWSDPTVIRGGSGQDGATATACPSEGIEDRLGSAPRSRAVDDEHADPSITRSSRTHASFSSFAGG